MSQKNERTQCSRNNPNFGANQALNRLTAVPEKNIAADVDDSKGDRNAIALPFPCSSFARPTCQRRRTQIEAQTRDCSLRVAGWKPAQPRHYPPSSVASQVKGIS